jgi:hypothetical protein
MGKVREEDLVIGKKYVNNTGRLFLFIRYDEDVNGEETFVFEDMNKSEMSFTEYCFKNYIYLYEVKEVFTEYKFGE